MSLKPPIENRNNPEAVFFGLEDLRTWDRAGTWLAVVGYPVRHSLSPVMHRAALRAITQQHPEYANWEYVGFEIPPEQFSEALPLFFEKGFYGLNLTLPHKVQALDLVAAVDPEARAMGAVNTLVRYADGFHGFNTDGYGLQSGLRDELQVTCRDREVLLLGAGGASRAAAVQCLKDGCRQLWVGNRSQERLQALLTSLPKSLADERVRPFNLETLPEDLPRQPIVINATSVGLKPDDPLLLDPGQFEPGAVFYDMIYNPWETRFLRRAREFNFPAANGLSMLVYQGARSLEIWTQVSVSVPVMDEAAKSGLKMQ